MSPFNASTWSNFSGTANGQFPITGQTGLKYSADLVYNKLKCALATFKLCF